MKIDVILASRGQPLRLMSVLTCFDALATGMNDITYRVICDEDDALTAKAMNGMPLQIVVHLGTNEIPVCARLNEAAKMSTADVITGAADDTFPLAQHWDGLIQTGVEQGFHAFSWQERNDPNNATMLVISRRWHDCIGYYLSEHFPFWFADTWISEVHALATGKPVPIVENLPWGGKRGKTRGMRDLEFWFKFFAATRTERLEEAIKIRAEFGEPEGWEAGALAHMAHFKDNDAFQLTQCARYETRAEGEEPSFYKPMKQLAEQWLITHRQ